MDTLLPSLDNLMDLFVLNGVISSELVREMRIARDGDPQQVPAHDQTPPSPVPPNPPRAPTPPSPDLLCLAQYSTPKGPDSPNPPLAPVTPVPSCSPPQAHVEPVSLISCTPPSQSQSRLLIELVDGRPIYHVRPSTPRTPKPGYQHMEEVPDYVIAHATPVQISSGQRPDELPQVSINHENQMTGPVRSRIESRKIKGRRSTPYPTRVRREVPQVEEEDEDEA